MGRDERGERRGSNAVPYLLAACCVAVAVWQMLKLLD